jgi:hypothetical protein
MSIPAWSIESETRTLDMITSFKATGFAAQDFLV